jgi:hypothetical protein
MPVMLHISIKRLGWETAGVAILSAIAAGAEKNQQDKMTDFL